MDQQYLDRSNNDEDQYRSSSKDDDEGEHQDSFE